MYRIVTCLTVEHDIKLVLLAVLVCSGSVLATFKSYAHALSDSCVNRQLWLVLTGLCGACGMWATHFVAMLAYEPAVAVGFEPVLTAVSLAIACVATWLGFWIAADGSRVRVISGGAIAGAGISAMHYSGMLALEVAGTQQWDPVQVAISLAAGVCLSAVAMACFHSNDRERGYWLASFFMVLAIAAMHFVGMAALTVTPDPTIAVMATGIDPIWLAVGITAVTAAVLVAGIVAALINRLNDDVAQHTANLRQEVEERKREQAQLMQRQKLLLEHQELLTSLMNDAVVRKASTVAAMRELSQELTKSLKVDRVGFWILDKSIGCILALRDLRAERRQVYQAGLCTGCQAHRANDTHVEP